MMYRTVVSIALIMACSGGRAWSQVQSQQLPNQPLELPQIIVEGSATVDVPGGAKESPSRPPRLTTALLDSINPMQKMPLPQVADLAWPMFSRDQGFAPGWLQASLGSFFTPTIQAGYALHADRYLIDLRGDLEASAGWQPHADYTKSQLHVMSTYLAPEKFLVFGGSITTASVQIDHQNYALFAVPSAPRRSTQGVRASLVNKGRVDSISFEGGLDVSLRGLQTVERSVSGRMILGSGRLSAPLATGMFSVDASLALRSYSNGAYPSASVAAGYDLPWNDLHASVRLGPQWSATTTGENRFGLGVAADVRYPASQNLTFRAHLSSGLTSIDHETLLADNPYLDDLVDIDSPYDLLRVRANVEWHPRPSIGAVVNVEYGLTERSPVWLRSGSGQFDIAYHVISAVRVWGDARWEIRSSDAVTFDGRVSIARVTNHNIQPYVPTVELSVGHDRRWSTELRTMVGVVYVGSRWADLENSRELSGFLDVRIDASYAIAKQLDLTLQGRNLIGSTMFLWEGYRERSFFLSAGILWRM